MAEYTLGDLSPRRQRQTAAFGLAILALLITCTGASGQPISDKPRQWKQSIERPSRAWDYDGKRILGYIGHDICLWDATTGELLHRMKGHQEQIRAGQFSPDGSHALSSSWMPRGPMQPMRKSKDTRTILWNLATGKSTHIFPGQVAGEFSPNGERILTFSQRLDKREMTYNYTDPETGQVRPQIEVQSVERYDIAAVWDVSTGQQLVEVKLDENSGPRWDTLHFSIDGSRFVYVKNGAHLPYNSSKAILFNTSDGREIGRASAENGIHRYTSGGALACFDSERASLFDVASGRPLRGIVHGLKTNWRGAWTHDGRKVAAFPPEGAIKIWDLESGMTVTGAKAGTYPHTVIISPDNSRLAIAWGGVSLENREVDPEFGLYDMNTGAEIAAIQLAKLGGLIGFSPDSKTLLAGHYETHISENEKRTIPSDFVIYSAENGKKIRSIKLRNEVNSSGPE